jgi:hypothetical protein
MQISPCVWSIAMTGQIWGRNVMPVSIPARASVSSWQGRSLLKQSYRQLDAHPCPERGSNSGFWPWFITYGESNVWTKLTGFSRVLFKRFFECLWRGRYIMHALLLCAYVCKGPTWASGRGRRLGPHLSLFEHWSNTPSTEMAWRPSILNGQCDPNHFHLY